MSQEITAPLTVRGSKIAGSLSDATAESALHEHGRVALQNLRWSMLATSSCGWSLPRADAPSVRTMQAITYASLNALNDAFSNITTTCVALQGLERAGRLYSETMANLVDRSGSPIDELPSTTLERFLRALGEWKGLVSPDHFDAMVRHVHRILSDQEELDEDDTIPSPSSFDDMLAFISSRPWDKVPAAGLNRKGQFSVSWTRSHPHTDVTLTFLGEGSIKWYVYGLGRKGNGSAAGTSDRLDLPGLLSGLGCDSWMTR